MVWYNNWISHRTLQMELLSLNHHILKWECSYNTTLELNSTSLKWVFPVLTGHQQTRPSFDLKGQP